jgi:hypothetical protein
VARASAKGQTYPGALARERLAKAVVAPDARLGDTLLPVLGVQPWYTPLRRSARSRCTKVYAHSRSARRGSVVPGRLENGSQDRADGVGQGLALRTCGPHAIVAKEGLGS